MVIPSLIQHKRDGKSLSPRDWAELITAYQVREVLEVRALALAWDRLERADIERFLEGNAPGTRKPDNGLHDYWIERSGNRYIRQFFA